MSGNKAGICQVKHRLGNVSAGADDSAGATHEATFTIKILEGGDGMLKFSGGEYKGPQIDRIVITRGS